MKPHPSQFRTVTAYRMAQAQHAEAVAFGRRFRRWLAGSLAALAVLWLFARWPGIALACVCILGPCLILAGAWLFEAAREGREYNEEHDL